jgi:hypothetical protein
MAAAAEKILRTLLADFFPRSRKFVTAFTEATKLRELCLLLKLGLS